MNNVCPRCHGMIKEGQIKMLVNDIPHHYYCGGKVEDEAKEKAKKELFESLKPRNQFTFDTYQ